jgi:hypothetical protein
MNDRDTYRLTCACGKTVTLDASREKNAAMYLQTAGRMRRDGSFAVLFQGELYTCPHCKRVLDIQWDAERRAKG